MAVLPSGHIQEGERKEIMSTLSPAVPCFGPPLVLHLGCPVLFGVSQLLFSMFSFQPLFPSFSSGVPSWEMGNSASSLLVGSTALKY